ncbi:MAG: hypothetical protein Q7S33_04745 [Nanoarchaeota archaeon]|nr:hypothetical protein [Nanoarchaeota archaeon]
MEQDKYSKPSFSEFLSTCYSFLPEDHPILRNVEKMKYERFSENIKNKEGESLNFLEQILNKIDSEMSEGKNLTEIYSVKDYFNTRDAKGVCFPKESEIYSAMFSYLCQNKEREKTKDGKKCMQGFVQDCKRVVSKLKTNESFSFDEEKKFNGFIKYLENYNPLNQFY